MIQWTLPFSEESECTTTALYDSMLGVNTAADIVPDDIDALKAALLAERSARRTFKTVDKGHRR